VGGEADAAAHSRKITQPPSVYFADATLASAFVARWSVGAKVETTAGVFQVRDEPAPRVGAGLYRTQ
jgi:hypothetical protein